MNEELELALAYVGKGADRRLEKQVFKMVRKATESLDALVDCDRIREAAEASQALEDYNDAMNGICGVKKSMESALREMPAAEISRAAEMLRDKTQLNNVYLFTHPVEGMVASARSLLKHVAVAQRSEEVMKAYLK